MVRLPSTVRWVSGNSFTSSIQHEVSLVQFAVGETMIVLHNLGRIPDIATPEGWTPLFSKLQLGSRAAWGYYRTKVSANETAITFTATEETVGWSIVTLGVTGADPEDWIIGTPSTRGSNPAGDTNNLILGVTSTENDSRAVIFSFEATNAMESPNTISAVNNGFTEVGYQGQWAESSRIETIWVGTKVQETAGPVGDTTVTYRNAQSANGAGLMIVLPPGPDTPVGYPIKMGDGRDAYLSYLGGGLDRRTPLKVRMLLPGFDSAQQFIETPGATMAHRGGSLDYPEMSEYAYDQAALLGYGCLEFSAQRSADGWWFGLHDPDLSYATGIPGLPNVSTMTKNEILEYANARLPMPGFPTRPFFGLEEFLDKYGKTHVLMLDPKNALPYNAEFLSICDSIVDPDRLIWKWYMGDGGNTMSNGAQAALNRGWGGTWGYGYSTNISNGTFQTNAAKSAWTILGLNFDAPQSDWDVALSYGKPVIGHIAQTQTHYDIAISKGANMVQCAGINSIKPVSAPR